MMSSNFDFAALPQHTAERLCLSGGIAHDSGGCASRSRRSL